MWWFLLSTISTTIVSGTSLWDVIPGTAQIKSLFQLVAGDPNGAANTQLNYLNQGVGPAQLRSAYFAVKGDTKKALDIQGKCFSNLEGLIDGIPVVGHIKGGVHLLAGDHDHGWDALKSATTTSGAIVGATVLGPFGALAGHFSTDLAITILDVLLNGNKPQPHGLIEYLKNIRKKDAGEHFDALAGLAMESVTGSKFETKTGSFNLAKTVKDNSKNVIALSYRDLLQAEAEDSVLEKQQGMFEWSENSGDSQKMRFTEKKNPVEEEEIRTKTTHEQVDTPPDTPAESPDVRVKSRDLIKERMHDELRTNLYKSNNKMKLTKFTDFLKNDPTYANFNFARFTLGELEKHSFRGLDKFADNNELIKIDVDAMKNKLHYLTDDEKSLITRNDFRTVNKDAVDTGTILSSLAGVMREDVKSLQRKLSKEPKNPYDPELDVLPKSYMKELNKRKHIAYYHSEELSGLKELNDHISTHVKFLEGKNLILVEAAGYEEGNAMVLKTKKAAGNPDPVKLFIDYQFPGFVQMGLPNPFRFTTYLEDPNTTYRIYVIGVEKES